MNTNGIGWSFLEKWMNMFTRDLYSMYMILQGIGSLSCIRVYIIYVIPFGEQQPWMSEVPKNVSTKKTGPPEIINFFLYWIKKISFWGSPKGAPPPTTGVVELWKNIVLQWTPMEIGSVPEKMDEYCHWGPISYVCNSARNLGPYHV